MTPLDDAHSPLATLRQLKEMLDAGTLTPAEFEALKRQLVFKTSTEAAPAEQLSVAPAEATAAPLAEAAAFTSPPPDPAPLKPLDWMAAVAPSMLPAIEADRAAALAAPPAPDRRNPLTLVFAIGGVLLLLAVMGYLLYGLPPKSDEHLTSTSQTAADTTATHPETGPQTEQLTLPPAAPPETVRVAPVVRPVAPVPAAATKFRGDSVTKSIPAVPAATPIITDSAAVKP